MKRNKWFALTIKSLMIALLFTAFACGLDSPEYTVTFVIDKGISGTPAAGTYTYHEFESVPYEYKATSAAYVSPEIYLNGSRSNSSGNLKVYNFYTVIVQQIDIRNSLSNETDQWEFSLFNKLGGQEEPNYRLRFTGATNMSGLFSDDRGYQGTWEITKSSELRMRYTDWKNATLLADITAMAGAWTADKTPNAYTFTASRK